MGYFNPLDKRGHSDFAFPRLKPIGDVAIDWDNGITRGLKRCLILQNGIVVDLVNAKLSTPSGAVRNITGHGDGFNFDESNDYIDLDVSIDANSAFTIVAGVDNLSSTDVSIYSESDTGSSNN